MESGRDVDLREIGSEGEGDHPRPEGTAADAVEVDSKLSFFSNSSDFMVHSNGELMLTIKSDFTIELNPKYTLNENAIAFWNAVMHLGPIVTRGRHQLFGVE